MKFKKHGILPKLGITNNEVIAIPNFKERKNNSMLKQPTAITVLTNKMTYARAFSMIELLIAIALFIIVLLTVMPPMQSMIRKNHASVYANGVMTALQFTRMAAIIAFP